MIGKNYQPQVVDRLKISTDTTVPGVWRFAQAVASTSSGLEVIFEPSKANAETMVRETQRTGLVGWDNDVVLDLRRCGSYTFDFGGILKKIFSMDFINQAIMECLHGSICGHCSVLAVVTSLGGPQNLGRQSQQSSPKLVYKPIHCHRGC